jgi:hypothetical protein
MIEIVSWCLLPNIDEELIAFSIVFMEMTLGHVFQLDYHEKKSNVSNLPNKLDMVMFDKYSFSFVFDGTWWWWGVIVLLDDCAIDRSWIEHDFFGLIDLLLIGRMVTWTTVFHEAFFLNKFFDDRRWQRETVTIFNKMVYLWFVF